MLWCPYCGTLLLLDRGHANPHFRYCCPTCRYVHQVRTVQTIDCPVEGTSKFAHLLERSNAAAAAAASAASAAPTAATAAAAATSTAAGATNNSSSNAQPSNSGDNFAVDNFGDGSGATTRIRCGASADCNGQDAYFVQMQLRSADEPPTTFYMCKTCKGKWRTD
jgi:DNA-directed RNA polymerase subunit M/transcription elongation factor TFIIS